ncbi:MULTISPECIES: hypothetical protein [Actinoalloteichus]|uniref:hypothetical protein n=1 Tax=Actinoalloteichus TaxID=65496 RepID=UPI0012F7C13E|nr:MULTISPECIES: hypothetical protein [Actinoalloteichus]
MAEVSADVAGFLLVLTAGYEVGGPVAEFIGAEHRLPGRRRFLMSEQGTPIGRRP